MSTKDKRVRLSVQIFRIELGAFLRVCEGVSTPRSLACYLMAKYECWEQYLALPPPDSESKTFADDYLVTECMRKNPRLPNLGIDRKAVAREKWFWAEAQCKATNDLLRSYRSGGISFPEDFETLLTTATSLIASVLGPLDNHALSFATEKFRFGPGATSSCSGREVVLSRKMVSRFDVTPGLYPYYRTILGKVWEAECGDISLCHSSKVQFVPKDAKTDRPIAVEPHANIFVQLGIGGLLRKRLKAAGLDLDTQADRNRLLASRAHKDGLATIDLSSASDTIAHELVWLLLPPEWARLLDTARTGYASVDGKMIRLEKFSSMGNGYTFELETLIFWSLARAAGDRAAVAFGDDIILTREAAPKLIAALNTLGFSVNERKTFLAGRFFESCGADYRDGLNVRPFYFRGEYHDLTSAVIRICNRIRIYAHRRNLGIGCDVRFLPAWLFCFHKDSRAGRTGVPLNAGDDGLVRNFDEANPSKLRHGHCGYAATVWRVRTKKSTRTSVVGAYLAALLKGYPANSILQSGGVMNLHEVECSTSYLDEVERGSYAGAAFGRQPVMGWPEPGPWMK